MSTDGQGTKRRRSIAENFNRLSRAHVRYRQTDGRAIAYTVPYSNVKHKGLVNLSEVDPTYSEIHTAIRSIVEEKHDAIHKTGST